PEEVMAFVDGELSAEDAQAVSTHLEHCTECTMLAGQFRETSENLRSWTATASTSSLETIVLGTARGDQPPASKPLFGSLVFRGPLYVPARWGLAMIAVAILISAGISRS